jgi:hypothetical protein
VSLSVKSGVSTDIARLSLCEATRSPIELSLIFLPLIITPPVSVYKGFYRPGT